MNIHILGFIGNVLFFLGAFFFAKKWIIAWYTQILANFCYVIYALMLGTEGISLCLLSIGLILVNYYGLKKWKNPPKCWSISCDSLNNILYNIQILCILLALIILLIILYQYSLPHPLSN